MGHAERSYKGLNLKREAIEAYVDDFLNCNSLVLRIIESKNNGNIKRIVVGRPGIDDAIIDLHLVNDGTTTINYKVGRNQQLGKCLADHLYETIDPGEFITVNLTLKGITSNEIEPILDELQTSTDETDQDEFSFSVIRNDDISKIVKIVSNQHQDALTLSHFKTTHKLTLQGRPLFTYRRIIYLLSELLDLSGLQSVLVREDANTVAVVDKDEAIKYLITKFETVFDQLPELIKDLLVSGNCVKLAKPKLPDYSLLLFPDLRCLEGILKNTLSYYGLYTDGEENGFGTFFVVHNDNCQIRDEFRDCITCGEPMVEALEDGYAFFRKHRHGLFHMSDFANVSRRVDTLEKADAISDDAYSLMRKMFDNRKS